MSISIKIKFSIFLAVLLLLAIVLLSVLALKGIERNQQAQVEQYLGQQAATANMYVIQTLMTEPSKVPPHTFLAAKGEELAQQLELITGHTVALYGNDGALISRNMTSNELAAVQDILEYALANKIAYSVAGDSLYYMSPLRIGDEQAGVVQFYYSLAQNRAFYNQIRLLFIYIGAGVFLLSFILAYMYFGSFANGIIRLNRTVDQIRQGNYKTDTSARKDEIGRLSEGIRAMSEQILKTIQAKDEERDKLTVAVRKLSLLDRQQKQFIGNVTHEFKTPLTSIKAYLDLLDMYPDDDELLETAKTNMSSETQRLYEMVEKVLQLSSLEKYEFEYNKETIEVRNAVLSVLNSLKGKMDKFGIRLETDLTEAYVEADKDSMTIVLVNVLDNAIKYNKAGGRIAVRSYVQDGRVIIEIADTGIGIPHEVAHKIFEPFYTVDKNRSRQHGGTGLGLSLAKTYADMQRGTLSLVSTGADGSTFQLSFPACS